MTFISCSARNVTRSNIRRFLPSSSLSRLSVLPNSVGQPQRCFHNCGRRWAEEGKEGLKNITDTGFWKEFKRTYDAPTPTFRFDEQIHLSRIGEKITAVGFLKKIVTISEKMTFAHLSGPGSEYIQVLCLHRPKENELLRSIRVGSAISVTGVLGKKHEPKNSRTRERDATAKIPDEGFVFLSQVEIHLEEIQCLNSFPANIHINPNDEINFNYPPQSRHLQIRFDTELQERLKFRSDVAAYARQELKDFQEVETPILFKSTPEGAREFLVPTRKKGYAYALPQSPQQYKQILMASGINRYFQFAKCFRDEDLRADRQPEFTQIDLEMAWTDGEGVMQRVESLIKSLYHRFSKPGTPLEAPLPNSPFMRMAYDEAMSRHGSDKPDLRIKGLIHRIEDITPNDLKGMLTSIENPTIEACTFRLDAPVNDVRTFVRNFMDSPDAEVFRHNPEGAPGFCIYDSRAPIEGLQTFGHDGAEKLKDLYEKAETGFDDGDLLIIQARPNLPHSGGSTVLGKLRLAIQKAAIAEGLIQPDPNHHYLWITDFPMFTLDNATDPGQGGASGFSATHHPFTAPKTPHDVDLLLTNPLKATADHYDLVVNGVELGGGSRRIHNAEMQTFIMREILEMSEERINDFSHLFEALRAGCPPHAGLAIGFDRLIAVMRGRESVKDVIAFPKSSKGEDMMVRSPSRITHAEFGRYHLELAGDDKVGEGMPVPEVKDEKRVEGMPSQA